MEIDLPIVRACVKFVTHTRGAAASLCLNTSIRQDEFSDFKHANRTLTDRKLLELVDWVIRVSDRAWESYL